MLTWQTQYSILMRYRQGGRQWAGQTGRSRATAARRTGAPISSAMRERACRTIAARRGGRDHPIVRGITRCAICPAAAAPKRCGCARPRRWRTWSAGAAGGRRRTNRRSALSSGWSGPFADFRDVFVLILFGRSAWHLPAPCAAAARSFRSRPARRRRNAGAIKKWSGSISATMRQAAEDFRACFAAAQLDPLRALDWSRFRSGVKTLRPDADAVGVRAEAARRAVWRAIQAVGGIASPAGSCLWHVVGWEQSLKEWACGQGWNGRRVSQEAASGILIAALGALEVHFGIAKNC